MAGREILTLQLVDHNEPTSRLEEDEPTSSSQWEAFRHSCGAAEDDLFSDPYARQRPRRFRFLCASLVLQALVLGIWVLRSVTADDELPPPQVVKTFMAVAPVVPAPPPPPPAVRPPSAPVTKSAGAALASRLRFDDMVAPSIDMEPFDVASFGLPDGTEGGVPGGVVGGLVGGVPAPPEPKPADPPIVYIVRGEFDRPDKLVHVDPVYPTIAATARVEGIVILEATIDGEGNVQDLRVLRSVPLLDEAAVDAVRHWKYEPTIIGGSPVPIQMTVTVRFALA